MFYYILPRWESFALNDSVVEDGIYNHNFKIHLEKYFLTDTDYHNQNHILSLYCNLQYLKEQGAAGLKTLQK